MAEGGDWKPITDEKVAAGEDLKKHVFFVAAGGRPAVSEAVARRSLIEAQEYSMSDFMNFLSDLENGRLLYRSLSQEDLKVIRGAQIALQNRLKLTPSMKASDYIQELLEKIISLRNSGNMKPEAIRRFDQTVVFLGFNEQ